ncbi:hypothetical protein BC826DRAFT_1037975 [Russula brevipes]|nr:hypothetical protein BC826DRAFT_1037975 [Russula brevipes]
MFQLPWMITMSIAATRMYRNLVDYGSCELAHESPLWQTGSDSIPRVFLVATVTLILA